MATIIRISGSLRRGSYNTALLHAAEQLMPDGTQLQIKTISRGTQQFDSGGVRSTGCRAHLRTSSASSAASQSHSSTRRRADLAPSLVRMPLCAGCLR